METIETRALVAQMNNKSDEVKEILSGLYVAELMEFDVALSRLRSKVGDCMKEKAMLAERAKRTGGDHD